MPPFIAVDFDGTLCRRAWPGIGAEMPGAMGFLRWLEGKGFRRTLWTCREDEKLDEALAWLAKRGFPRKWWTSVNALPPASREAFGTDPRKIGAALFVDDNAVGFPVNGAGDPDWERIRADVEHRLAGGDAARAGAAADRFRAVLRGGVFGGVAKASAGEGMNAPKRFVECVAYNGSILPVDGWEYPVVVDLAGLRIKDKSRPVLFEHDPDRPVGHFLSANAVNTGRELLVSEGVFSASTPEAARVIADALAGFPWQMSITARLERGPDGKWVPGCLEFLDRGREAVINGRTLSGPLFVFRKSWLDEISFVVRGADDDTSVALAARLKGETTKINNDGLDSHVLPQKSLLKARNILSDFPFGRIAI